MTNFRFYHLVNLILERALKENDADRILDRFSRELRTVLTVAQRSYSQAVEILDTSVSEQRERWKEELRRLCQILLFDVDQDSCVSLNLETFGS